MPISAAAPRSASRMPSCNGCGGCRARPSLTGPSPYERRQGGGCDAAGAADGGGPSVGGGGLSVGFGVLVGFGVGSSGFELPPGVGVGVAGGGTGLPVGGAGVGVGASEQSIGAMKPPQSVWPN